MSSTRIRVAIAVVAASTVVLGGALTGCSVSRDEPDKPAASDSPKPTPSESSSTEPTESPTATPSATTSPSASRAPTPQAALLSATEMPQLNPTSKWTERRTGPVSARPFGLCQKFDVLSIGALDAVERTFTHDTDIAGQQVADFPDAQNAVRASKVFEAWQRTCANRLRGNNVRVRAISDVPVTTGKAWWYLVSFESRGEGHFHSFGLVLSGTRMTLIRMDHNGQDHNYDPGKDPMQLAVKAAAAKLG